MSKRIQHSKVPALNKSAIPIDPEEFDRVIRFIDEGYDGPFPEEMRTVTLPHESGGTKTLVLADMPYIRLLRSVREYCGEDCEKFESLTSRLEAYRTVMNKRETEAWMLFDPNSPDSPPLVHPAISEVAATMPLRLHREFDFNQFLHRVQELDKTKYADLRQRVANLPDSLPGGFNIEPQG